MTSDEGRGLSLRSVGRSALILTGGTAAAQFVGIARELFVAAQEGVSGELDALIIAMILPLTLAGVLTTGAVTALVPAYLEERSVGGLQSARRLAGTVLVWVGLGGIVLSLALEAFAGIAVAITGPGLSPVGRENAVAYLHLLAPVAFVAAVSGILYAVCQAEERFVAIAWAMLAGPATTLVTMLLLWNALDLGAYALGSLLGPIATAVVLLAATARAAAIPRLTVRPVGIDLRAFVQHAAPLTLSSAIGQLVGFSDRAIASLLAPGAVSVLRYADVLVRLPVGAISPAWGAAIYPALVRSVRQGRESGLGAESGLAGATARSFRYATVVFVPLAALTAAVAPVAVAVAYGRGAFTAADLSLTAQVVAAFAPLIVIMMISPVLTGAHNALRHGGVLLAGGILTTILNLILDVALGLWLGVAGVALASSIASSIVVIFFARRLARSEESFRLRPLARTVALALLASLPPALAIAAIGWSGTVPPGTLPGLATLAVLGMLGLMAYVAVATWIGLDEPRALLRLGLDRIGRRGGPAPPEG